MTAEYVVAVSRDDRLDHRGYDMGLGTLMADDDVEVVFLPPREHDGLRPADIGDAHALVLLKDSIGTKTMRASNNLEIIARFGAGFDSVDMEAATAQGILVTNAPQGVRDSVAQTTVGMLISCASHMRRYDHIVRKQGFEGRLENMGVELFDKTLGTIGLGQIGKRVIDLLEPFSMDYLTYDPYLTESEAAENGVSKAGLTTLLEESDFISIHCPLTEETKYLLGFNSFRRMKSTAYLVNTTRGGIYPDEDLAKALESGEIAGAAIDVFEKEPHVEDNPLLKIPDCHVMPHAAGINMDGLTHTGEIVSESILSMVRDELPRNILNPDALDTEIPPEKLSPSFI